MNEQILVYLLIVILTATGAATIVWARDIHQFYRPPDADWSATGPLVDLVHIGIIRCCGCGLIVLAMVLLARQYSN